MEKERFAASIPTDNESDSRRALLDVIEVFDDRPNLVKPADLNML
jgi:hypothetical protein